MATINLKNVELQWAWLAKPNTTGNYPSNKYQVDVVFDGLTKKEVEGLINKKQKIRELGDGKYSITLKSSIKPKVIDKNKAVVNDATLSKVGNGTKAVVQVNQYKGFKDEMYLGLSAIMITELKTFDSEDSFSDIVLDDDNFDDDPL